jgi:hypothetical protein
LSPDSPFGASLGVASSGPAEFAPRASLASRQARP